MTHDSLLFTPGPLTTSPSVKAAMLHDLGSRDGRFVAVVSEIRRRLLRIAEAEDHGFEAVLMQGSGTFGIESVIGSTVPADGRLLVLSNGAYGKRIVRIASVLGIPTEVLEFPENVPVELSRVAAALGSASPFSHVAIVHCETTTGILNPVREVGQLVRQAGCRYIVDSMSGFGGIPISVPACGIDFLVSSANKCIQGVPGFSFAIVERSALLECRGRARSLSLDLHAQWEGLERDGQFRFTPPTHALLAFRTALEELEAEGGVDGRAARYAANHQALVSGMSTMGFQCYLPPEHRSHIITSFRYPDHPAFDFGAFYDLLARRGFVIYPGKLTHEDCFRIGNIGHLFPGDIEALLSGISEVLGELSLCLTS